MPMWHSHALCIITLEGCSTVASIERLVLTLCCVPLLLLHSVDTDDLPATPCKDGVQLNKMVLVRADKVDL